MAVTMKEHVRAQLHARRDLPPPERCRELRVRAGLPQRWIGEKVGVTREAVAMWERGVRTPRPGTVHRARYLEILEALEELG